MNIGMALMLAGLAQSLSGLVFFRQPSVSSRFFGPVWRASKYLTPPGVALWVGGLAVSFVGVLLLAFTRL